MGLLRLLEKYTGQNGSYGLFISNRVMRLYPVYWVVLALAILAGPGVFHGPVLNGVHLNHSSWIYLVLTNLFLFGQDWAMFMGVHRGTGTLFFTSNFLQTKPALYTFLLVPQAWTLGVELTFYLIAPFLLKLRLRWLAALIGLTVLIRVVIHFLGFYHDPWTYRFFPTEMGFFLVGRFSYEIYRKLPSFSLSKAWLPAVAVFAIAFTVFFPLIPTQKAKYAYFAVMLLSIPLLFQLTKRSRLDRILGDLSYPVYVSHLLVALEIYRWTGGAPWIAAAVTLAFSLLLNVIVQRPVDRWRQRRLLRGADRQSVAAALAEAKG